MRTLRGLTVMALLVAPFVAACGASTQAAAPAPRATQTAAPTSTSRPAAKLPDGPLHISIFKSTEGDASVNSYLVAGKEDLLVIDAQLVNNEAQKLTEAIKATGKKLRWVYVTHPHPDHFMGLSVLKSNFPNVEILSKKRVADRIPTLFEKYKEPLNKFFPGDVAASYVTPKVIEGNSLTVEGTELRILELENGESEYATILHVPAMRTVFAADLVYDHVHPWLNEMHTDGVLEHVEMLRKLDVDVILPGHGDPITKAALDDYTAYVKEFLSVVETAKDTPDVIATMRKRHPDYRTPAGLNFSAAAHIEARDAKRSGK